MHENQNLENKMLVSKCSWNERTNERCDACVVLLSLIAVFSRNVQQPRLYWLPSRPVPAKPNSKPTKQTHNHWAVSRKTTQLLVIRLSCKTSSIVDNHWFLVLVGHINLNVIKPLCNTLNTSSEAYSKFVLFETSSRSRSPGRMFRASSVMFRSINKSPRKNSRWSMGEAPNCSITLISVPYSY